jgi:NADH-quinone oxidoreductase subunit J
MMSVSHEVLFGLAAVVAVVASLLAITRAHAVHALLFLVVSLLAVAVIFFLLGAPFVAALEVIVYAGAIIVFFIFVVMMLDQGPQAAEQERQLIPSGIWIGPAVLALVLLVELLYVIVANPTAGVTTGEIGPQAVGLRLFTEYGLAVELASFVLLAGLVGAYHLGRRPLPHRDPEENRP